MLKQSKYIAHSENSDGEEQSILQHSEGVAELMKSFALADDLAEIYSYCGLLHDIGKYSKGFQNYIRSRGEKEPHAKWGAYIALMNKLINVAFPIIGHHVGLPNKGALRDTLDLCENDGNRWKQIQQALKEDGAIIPMCNNSSFNKIGDVYQKELFIRLLFSALVDADSLDTERHFQKEQYDLRSCKSLDVDALLDALNKRFESFKQDSALNRLRTNVRLYAQGKANEAQGCFSMTLPTGMGKTLTSLNWALHHAKAHPNIKRIVIVLPFISIIDQTANELKTIFKDYDVILEHHSSVSYEGGNEEECYCRNSKELAAENWDYPLVICNSQDLF